MYTFTHKDTYTHSYTLIRMRALCMYGWKEAGGCDFGNVFGEHLKPSAEAGGFDTRMLYVCEYVRGFICA